MKMKMKELMTEREKEMENEWEKEREREKEGERERGNGRGNEREENRHGPPNTYALAQMTLKITIGCFCRGPSRCFQGACRFSTHKDLPNGWTLWFVFQEGSNETEKTRARELVHRRRCSKWSPLARTRTHARHL